MLISNGSFGLDEDGYFFPGAKKVMFYLSFALPINTNLTNLFGDIE